MIAQLKGTLDHKTPDKIIIDVGGVGYELTIPLTTYSKLPELGASVILKTVTFVRDDSIELFGFLDNKEKELFLKLITVSGVGPKLARNIISGGSIDNLIESISGGDKAALQSLPGVGKKTAERLLLELRDKVAEMGKAYVSRGAGAVLVAGSAVIGDALSALKNLGYKAKDAESVLLKISKDITEDTSFEDIFKKALKALNVK